MIRMSLRTAAMLCLAIWLAVWGLFLALRFSPFDIRAIPWIGPILLAALAAALLAPVAATVLAGAALIRQPRLPLHWLILACAVAALFGQGLLFLVTKWL